ncbi:hypothetical protein Btru_059594 [Bulinus truncatus]|nr:hypothetical protein Btru_059594 [Bulinus truncatus]
MMLFIYVFEISAFNVNVKNIRELTDPNSNGFGFSTALYKNDNNALDAFVGAPLTDINDVNKLGVVYKYQNILDEGSPKRDKLYNASDIVLVNRQYEEGFGSTVVVKDQNLLVCSPRWKDTDNVTTNYYTYQLGRCVLYRPGNVSWQICSILTCLTSYLSESVLTGSTTETVLTGSITETVLTGSTTEPVITGSTIEPVLTGSTTELVITGSTTEPVITGSTIEPVLTGSTTEPVITGPTEHVITGAIEQVIIGQIKPVITEPIEPVINGPIEPVITGPLEPFITGPIEPVITGPIEHVITGPIEPVITGPIEHVITGPIEPVITGPIEPVLTGSTTEPVITGPTEPVITGPIEPVITGPIEHVITGPIEPVITGPIEPVITGPIEPVITGPIEHVITGPIEPVITEPIEPVITGPIEHVITGAIEQVIIGQIKPVITEPIEPVITGPIEPVITGPLEPFITGPIEPVITGPIEHVITGPIEPVITGPIEPVITGPLEPFITGPIEPVITVPIEHVITGPIEPVITGPIEPVITGPIEHVITGPIEPVITGPIEHVITGAIEQVIIGQIKHVITEPIEPVITGPIEPVITGPLEPFITGPIEPVITGPIEHVITGPIEPVITGPIEPVITGLIEQVITGPIEPFITGPIEPFITGPIEPVITGPIEPVITVPIEHVITGPIEQVITGPIEQVITGPIEPVITGPIELVFTSRSPTTTPSSSHSSLFIVFLDIKDRFENTYLAPFYDSQPKRKYVKRFQTSSFYWTGLASYGFSADMDEKFMAMGSPGVFNFEGSVYIHNLNNTAVTYETAIQLDKSNLNTRSYGFLGYSVKFGRFCTESFTDICLAAGAPNMFSFGQVKLLMKNSKNTIPKHIQVQQEINGTEMWSNFGYSLGVISLKNDDYDQLLVGAPLYTEWGNPDHIPDQGVVYQFYYSSDTQKFEKHDIVLDGSRQAYARFGSAISNIGDINLDQFPDIAIGAPGENDNAGSIYIYLGSATGLTQVKGFGFALSNKQFPKNKTYPVFAASSVVSKTVAVFQCRPIVEVEVQLTATPNPVDTKLSCNSSTGTQKSCFNVKICLKHNIKGDNFQPLNYSIRLYTDTKIKTLLLKRALFPNDKDLISGRIQVQNKDVPVCFESIANLKESQINRDRFTPINVVAEYSLEQTQGSANEPVLDATKANNKTIEVIFVNECGTDGKCEVNLILNADLHIQPASQWPDIVVNHTKELTVEIGVINKAETAYGVTANIEIDTFLLFIRAKSDHSCEPGTISANVTDISLVKDKTLITCNFFEPLDPTGQLKFNVVFDTDQDNVKKNDLLMKVDVMPKNPVHNPEISQEDNLKLIQKKVFIISNITLESLSTPNDHTKSKSQDSEKKSELLNVTHKILVRNQGPSFLPTTKISVAIPFYLKDDVQLVTQADVKMLTPAGEALCKSTSNTGAIIEPSTTTQLTTEHSTNKDLETTTEEPTDDGGPGVNRKRRSIDSNCHEKTCFIDCKKNVHLCQVYICELNTIIQPKLYAEINVSMVLDLSMITLSEKFNTVEFKSLVVVEEPQHPLFKTWGSSKQHETITTFHFIQSGGEINYWIIIGSIIAGLVLITIIVIVLWKLGFFKRTKHLEVQKMKRESMRRSMKESSKSPADE